MISFLQTKKILGNFLFSHSLSSALSGLTSVFGMGTGVPHLLSLPRKFFFRNNSLKTQILCSSNYKFMIKSSIYQYWSTQNVTILPSPAYLPCRLQGILLLSYGKTHLKVGFPLRCFQRLSFPNIATLHCHWRDNRYTRGLSIPVLSY